MGFLPYYLIKVFPKLSKAEKVRDIKSFAVAWVIVFTLLMTLFYTARVNS